ncbi:MAG: hypothetical protein KatS3mg031_3032 [Chitinophagales bacterium]|nr:MAG: hypothetical protein KatS3mg031_3032 [Chitinophagales bacterium]
MATKGQVLYNEKTREKIEFVETSSTTNGERTTIIWTMTKEGSNPVEHLHKNFDEHFEILTGKMSFSLGKEKGFKTKGEKFTFPSGVPHRHWNEQVEDLVVKQTISPAFDMEDVITTLFQFAAEGKMQGGNPPLLQVMYWLKYGKSKTYLAAIPVQSKFSWHPSWGLLPICWVIG